MNESRIIELRQERGWTQDKLAAESGVGIRTIQRLEAGNDASLETLSLVAEALHVTVRELFTAIDSDELSGRVESFEVRMQDQQVRRNRITTAWLWIFIGIGVSLSFISFAVGGTLGAALFLGYWGGGTLIFFGLRRLYLDSHLDEKLPLSRSKSQLRAQKRR